MKRLFLLMVFLAVSVQVDAARMSSYTENTTPNADVYFIGVDPNDTTQTVNGSNYRYPLSSILGSGLFDFNVNSLTVSGTGDSWVELENNTSFTDTLTGKYGLRFYNGVLQQIINGTASAIGSGSFAFDTYPTYEDSAHSSGIAVNGTTLAVYSAAASKWLTVALTDSLNPTPTLPTFSSAEQTDGTTFVLTLSEAITIGSGGSGGVVVTGSTTGASSTTYASGDTTASLTYTTAETFVTGETITVAYTQPGNGLEDADGDDIASFTGQAVTNSIVAPSALNDTFTDVDSTALASHTSDSSHTWTQNGGGGLQIYSNRVESVLSTSAGLYYSSYTPVDADYSVQMDCITIGTGVPVFVAGRCSTSAVTMYGVRWDGTNTWDLSRWVAGTRTSIGIYVGDSPVDTSRTVKLSMVGTTIAVDIDGVNRISVTDSTITAAGRPGIGTWYCGPSHAIYADNMVVTE